MTDTRRFEDFAIGECASIDRVVGAHDVARFVEVTGDDNPVHIDDEYASAIGIGGRIVHGMLTAGYVSTVIGTLLPGPGALWLSQIFRFRAPVRIDDHIHVKVRIRHISPATRVVILDVSVTNQHQKVVLDGEAQVQVLDKLPAVSDRPSTGIHGCAVITGSGRGIGAAIAARLAADGLPVIVNYQNDENQADETTRSICAAGGQATKFRADVADPDAVASLVRFATDQFGSVGVVVNNAGGAIDHRTLVDTSWGDVERHLATHLRGSFLCVQAVLPGMIEGKFGRIVNITSQSAFGVPPPNMTGYVVAKAALAALTRCIALEAGPHGVTANAVAPGMVETELVADIPQRTKMALAAQSPLRRLVSPADVAEAVAFLVGPGGAHVTGQTIHLSGGQVMP